MVDSTEQYPHLSYKYYAYGKEDDSTNRDAYYDDLEEDDKKRMVKED